jgi:alanyl-tRNA synthetase
VPIEDTLRNEQGVFLHKIKQNVPLEVGEKIILNVDIARRKEIQRHHTATHIMHAALRKILGGHVKQCGSHISEHGLRFDFNNCTALARDELDTIEQFVNAIILENLPVTAQEMFFKEIPVTCIAHFHEKYGEMVRVLSIGDISMELCGGCHASSTGELGIFKIVKESAISAGMRRIEAVVGQSALEYMEQNTMFINELEECFSVKKDEILIKIHQLQHDKNVAEYRLRTILKKNNQEIFDEICRSAIHEDGLKKISGIFEIENINDLRSMGRIAVKQEEADMVILAGNLADSSVIIINCSPKGVDQNCDASRIAREIAEKFDGKGGGNPAFAMVNFPKRLEFAKFHFHGFI